MKYMLITNSPALAEIAVEAGVDRIFVDLERIGKFERQGHRDTLISSHSIEDVAIMRGHIGTTPLLVRINPFYKGTADEVEAVITAGADLIMLPMFKQVDEIQGLSNMVAGRVGIVPLFETPESITMIEKVASISGVEELYLGLNDLHIALGLKFMFELLVNGVVEDFAKRAAAMGVPFGFGGVASSDDGALPGRFVIAEHVRLGSSSVILSRTFNRILETGGDSRAKCQALKSAIDKMREIEYFMAQRTTREIKKDVVATKDMIGKIAANQFA